MILLFALMVAFFYAPSFAVRAFEPGKRLFLVTAYYSPLPDQNFYVRGSYEADIRLNGRGTNGADGTQVYMGMLAAPSIYAFGTKVQIPGLGVGAVHDRGGAILQHRDYDRIDVWMGKGEPGLARALRWGSRLVEGEIMESSAAETIDFNWIESEIPSYALKPVKRYAATLDQGPRDTASVRELQEALRQFGYYHDEVNGELSPALTEAITTFQLDNLIIDSPLDSGAGHFGPKTNQKLKEKLEYFNVEVEAEKGYLRENIQDLKPGLGKEAQGDSVVVLQKILRSLGYHQGPITGVYDPVTIDSVLAFQKRYDLVAGGQDKGAGYFGPHTHQVLIAAATNRMIQLNRLPLEKQLVMPAHAAWPKMSEIALQPTAESSSSKLNFSLWTSLGNENSFKVALN